MIEAVLRQEGIVVKIEVIFWVFLVLREWVERILCDVDDVSF